MVAALTAAEIREANSVWLPDFIQYVTGWERRNNGTSWGDVTGYGIHHTGDDASDKATLNVLINGHSSLPGPLCTEAILDDGTISQVSIGPANHFGGGDPDVLAAVRAESYGDYPPAPNEHHGSPGSVGGNRYFYGGETAYGGGSQLSPTAIQYRSMVMVAASRIWALDKKDTKNAWTAKSAIGHKEWSDWKPDPRNVDMKQYRADVQWCLDVGPAAAQQWHKTGSREDDIMPAMDKNELRDLIRGVVRDEVERGLTELEVFRTHDTYDFFTGERLEDVTPRKGSLEYAVWCAVRDSRQAKEIALALHAKSAPDADEQVTP